MIAPRRPPAFIGTADPGYDAVKTAVIRRTGHHYYTDKDELLWDRLRRRLEETGAKGIADYLRLLDDPERGPAEWRTLEAAVTVGETFFFRYAEQFAALRDVIVPELLDRRSDTRRLRIWSAGCSNGAEPYSLAVLLAEMLGDRRADWNVAILGTDLSEAALEAAREGVFGAWSLRGMPPEERDRWFDAGRDGRSYALKRRYREGVRFERHNLMSLVEGTSPLQVSDFDLVLCRNVLIYFSAELAERLAAALRDTLVPDGWLLVGHAEATPAFAAVFETVELPGTTAYRRGATGSRRPAPASVPLEEELLPFVPILPPAAPALEPEHAPEPPPEPVAAAADPVEDVRRRADLGDLAGARAAARAGIAADRADARLHFYDGLVSRSLADGDGAERAFRRALYLDRNLVLAHYHLGLLLIETGRPAAGQRALANAAHLAAAMPPDVLVAEGDGLTAGRLLGIVRHLIDGAARTA